MEWFKIDRTENNSAELLSAVLQEDIVLKVSEIRLVFHNMQAFQVISTITNTDILSIMRFNLQDDASCL